MADRRGPSRRKDSSQMWEESERSRPARDVRDSRDSRPSRDTRHDRERNDRRRSYRSRSRERDSGERGSGRYGNEGRNRERDRAAGSLRHRGELPNDGRARERRRSRSHDARRSRSPRLDKGLSRGRPTKESIPPYDNNAVLKSTEAQDPNRMEVEMLLPTSHPADSHRLATTSATPQPELVKTTNTVENNYDEDIEVEIDPDVAAMQAMMGFGGFGSTQNKKVAGNDVSAVSKEKKTEYRQYMNRVGGFNRPLSPTRE